MINSVNNISFRQETRIVPVSAQQNKPQAQPEEKSDNTKIYLALTALATLGAGALLYHKLKAKPPEVKAPHETPKATEAESSASKVAESAEAEDGAAKATETAAKTESKEPQGIITDPPAKKSFSHRVLRNLLNNTPKDIFEPNIKKRKVTFQFSSEEHNSISEAIDKLKPNLNPRQEEVLTWVTETFRAQKLGNTELREIPPPALYIASNRSNETEAILKALPELTGGKVTDIRKKDLILTDLLDIIGGKKKEAAELSYKTGQKSIFVAGNFEEIIQKTQSKMTKKEFESTYITFLDKVLNKKNKEMPHITFVFDTHDHEKLPVESLHIGAVIAAKNYNYLEY